MDAGESRPLKRMLARRDADRLNVPSSLRSWVRCSAQVWNELEDFDYLARVLLEVCSKIKDGSWEAFSA